MLDEGDGGIHLRPPHDEGFVKRHSRLLQIGDVRIPDVILGSDLVEVLCEGCFLAHEALLELGAQLCHLLDVGIHGTKLGLLTTCVMDGFQDGAGSRLLIPLVSSCRRGIGRRREIWVLEQNHGTTLYGQAGHAHATPIVGQ
jgi:hypothetical protein